VVRLLLHGIRVRLLRPPPPGLGLAIYLRHERVVAVTDFEFLGRRPRIDDLTLLLYFAMNTPASTAPGTGTNQHAELTPLVHAYASQLATPLTQPEMTALPIVPPGKPLWTYGTRLVADIDDDRARRDALTSAPAVARALEVRRRKLS
jgi:hypothetical protein